MKFSTRQLALLGLITALLIIFSFTPIGTIPIGTLSISLNVIPMALAAVTLGPVGGAIVGGTFGFLSFLQCLGIGIASPMGAVLFSINPFLAFVQRFIPRLLDGFLLGFIFKGFKRLFNSYTACFLTGFFSAFLNTLFFMSALVGLFGKTEYMQEIIKGRNLVIFICSYVGINAICEMLASTVITGAVCSALIKARLISSSSERS